MTALVSLRILKELGHGFYKQNNCIDSHGADFKCTTLNLGVKVLVYLRKLSVFMITHTNSSPEPLELR